MSKTRALPNQQSSQNPIIDCINDNKPINIETKITSTNTSNNMTNILPKKNVYSRQFIPDNMDEADRRSVSVPQTSLNNSKSANTRKSYQYKGEEKKKKQKYTKTTDQENKVKLLKLR
jgi:hypothetical protein